MKKGYVPINLLKKYIQVQELQILSDAESMICSSNLRVFLPAMPIAVTFFNGLITRCKAFLEQVQRLPCDSGYAQASPLRGQSRTFRENMSADRLLGAASCTPSRSCPSAGSSSRALPGWRRTAASAEELRAAFNTSLQFFHLAFPALLPKRS